MRLTWLAAILVLGGALGLPGQDYAALVDGTDRRDNLLILEMLRSPELSTALTVARALGAREDPYIADVLVGLLEVGGSPDAAQRELVLAMVLAHAFAEASPELRPRVEANREALELLAARLMQFSPALQRELLRLLALLPEAAEPGTLMALGMGLSESARRQGGRLRAEQAAVTVRYLQVLEALGDADFAPVALMLLEGTRDTSVARAARRTARRLLAASP